jgi:hypothetical protein
MAGAEARYTAQISGLITPEDRTRMDEIAEAIRVSFGDVLRECIEEGLPIVAATHAAKVKRARSRTRAEKAADAEAAVQAAVEEMRAARRG